MRKKGKNNLIKEEVAEGLCFKCKEGGELLICDYGDCLKTYHVECINGDTSFIKSGSKWTCDCHFCSLCKKRSKFCCLCCPEAVCQRCYDFSEFQTVKGKKAFCNYCLKLALLAEENKDVDSDGEKVDFSDLQTYEGLFLDYWEMIKKQEGLSLEHLHSADARLRKKNCISGYDPEEFDILEWETDGTSDYEDGDDIKKQKRKRVSQKKRCKEQTFRKKMDVKSSKREFINWGSKSLILFLQSIGKDTSKTLSQFEVFTIVNGYINENKLFDPNKKKKVMCDKRLKCLLGKKSLNRNRIYNMLESHLLENIQLSDEDDLGYNLENQDLLVPCKKQSNLSTCKKSMEKEVTNDFSRRFLGLSDEDDLGYGSENQDLLVPCKKQRNLRTCKKSVEKEVTTDFSRRSLAAIVPENIKLIYLKRSLVEELLKQSIEFRKVIGCFVRVKSNPDDYLQKNSHQLVQVRGIKRTSVVENKPEFHLEITNMPKDMHISLLSDYNFTEEECEDLRKRVKDGLLGNPTVEELEDKARSLHEDITKHWIIKELDLLQNYIDKANEKGWRSEYTLSLYLERRQLLQTPSEQSRLLQQIPKVVASIAEPEPMADDATKEDETDDSLNPFGASVVAEEKLQSEVTFQTEQRPGNDLEPTTVQNKEVSPPLELIDFSSDGCEDIGVAAMKEEEPCQTTKSITASFDLEPITVGNHQASPPQLIELSSDDDDCY